MSTILTPTITSAGLQAVFNAQQNGLQAKIKSVALGDQGYTPNQTLTRLKNEISRLQVQSGKRLGDHQLHINLLENSSKNFWVKEVGFYLDDEDETLFAVYSHPSTPLAHKSPQVDLLLAFDLALTGVPGGSVDIEDIGADINILLAPELAKMATAEINTMSRHIKQTFALLDAGILD